MNEDFFEYAPEGLAVIDENGSVLCSNKRFCSYFGDIRKLKDIIFLDRMTKTPLPVVNFDYYFCNPHDNVEALYINKNNTALFFSISYTPFTENDEKRLYLAFKDVTGLVYNADIFEQLYNKMSRLSIELNDLNKEKDKAIQEKNTAIQDLKKRDMEMKRQLLLAQDIQKKLFPPIRTLFENYEIASKIAPAEQVSGDLVFFFQRDQTHIDIISADVTGHGIPAALITILLRTSLQNAINAKHNPSQVLKDINNDLYDIFSNAGLFAAIMYCQIDILSDEITVFNCGHPAPFHLKSKKIAMEENEAGGRALGTSEDLEFKQQIFHLDAGDFLFIVTDGIIEAMNESGVFFEDTFKELLIDISKNHADFSPIDAIRFLLDNLDNYIQVPKSYKDDVTIICIKKISERVF